MTFLEEADMLGRVFWFFALAGTFFFAIRLGMMMIGQDFGEDGLDADIGDSDAAFEMLSINSITAFVMMFGWAGLTSYIQFSHPASVAIVVALLVGVLSMLLIAWLFQLAKGLTSSGATFDIKDTVGLVASVYQNIPAQGRGRINVTTKKDVLKELDAISEEQCDIASFEQVEIVKVIDKQTVSVKKRL